MRDKYSYDYYKENFLDKFNALLARKYHDLPPHKRKPAFYNDTGMKDKVSNWIKRNPLERSVPSLDTLLDLCGFFDCDIDYFLTDQTEPRSDYGHASLYIGLDYETTERISEYPQKLKELLNVIVYKNHSDSDELILKNADYFKDFLESIEKYSISSHIDQIVVRNPLTGETSKLSYEYDSARINAINRSEPMESLNTLLNCVYTEHSPVARKMFDAKIRELEEENKRLKKETEEIIKKRKDGD